MEKYIIVLPSGEEISSGIDTVNAIASIKHTKAVNSGTDLNLGSVCAAMVEATLITPRGGFYIAAGEEITLYTEAEDGTRKQQGIFAVDKPTRSSANRTKLTAYDRVAKLDKDLSEWLSSLTEYPYKLQRFMQMVCAECGVSLAEQEIPNAEYEIIAKPTDGTVTGRQLMQWCAEIAGKYITANPMGELEFGWYTETEIVIEPSGDNFYYSGSLTYEDYSVTAVDAVKLRFSEADNGAIWPPGDAQNPYIVTGNKILALAASSVNAGILEPMLTAAAISYTPCQFSVPVTVGIEPGQIIRIRDINGTEFSTLVMETVRSGQKLTVKSSGNSTRSTSESFYTDQVLKDYADAAASEAVKHQTQQQIFDKLTNGGQNQGVYLRDGKIYLNAEFMKAGYLSADIIRAGHIRSTDFELGNYPIYYPDAALYPSSVTFPSNGEQIVRGFEIDFESGVIRGVFWIDAIEALQKRIDELDTKIEKMKERLVYPISKI